MKLPSFCSVKTIEKFILTTEKVLIDKVFEH